MKNAANAAKRDAIKTTDIVMQQNMALKAESRSRCATNKLAEPVRDRIHAAEFDALKAEEAREAAEVENAGLREEVKRLRGKMDSTSRVEFDRLRISAAGKDPSLIGLLGKAGEVSIF